VQNTLDLWPVLPIVVRAHLERSKSPDPNKIIAALKLHNRVCDIDIHGISNTFLKKLREMNMRDPFPALRYLRLYHGSQHIDAAPLPDSFLGESAPQLQTLCLSGIPFPALPTLLLSAHDLLTLDLWNIPPSGYISPEAMVTILSVLTKLQKLLLGFQCPRSRADRENRLLPRLTRIVFPALTSFDFKGDSEYLEDIVGQFDTPLLDQLDLMFFNQLIFETPLLYNFIGRIEMFKTSHRADIEIRSNDIRLRLFRRDGDNYHYTLRSAISCSPLDWQVSSLAQVTNSALSHLLTFEHLEIDSIRQHRHDDTENVHWQDDMENAQWLEALHPFTSVKDLVLGRDLIEVVAPALEDLVGERVTEVLPALKNLFVESRQRSEPVKKAMGRFISARRLSGCPVTVHHRESWRQDYVLWEVGDQ
jgi:hypothetical protein